MTIAELIAWQNFTEFGYPLCCFVSHQFERYISTGPVELILRQKSGMRQW
jgi:hypothetical protein